jgi:hypothetical protein
MILYNKSAQNNKDLAELLQDASYQTKLASLLQTSNSSGFVVLRIKHACEPEITRVSNSMVQIANCHSKQEVIDCLQECKIFDKIIDKRTDFSDEIGQKLFQFLITIDDNNGEFDLDV